MDIDKTLVLQRDHSDCGVACLSTIINYYGGQETLETLRTKSGTSKSGTTLLGLYQAANSVGFKAEGCEADIDALIAHPSPTILHVLVDGSMQHYVVCYGYDNGEFLIGDPARGVSYYSKEKLSMIWQSKKCLTLEPDGVFQRKKDIVAQKKTWFLNILKEDYRLLSLSVGLGIGVAVLGMAMAIFSQKLIDDILPSEDIEKLITGIVLLSFLLLVRVGMIAMRSYFLIQQSRDFNNRIIDHFYSSLLNLPKPFFDTRKIGDMVARLNDTNRIQRVIKQVASNFIIDFLIALVSLGFLYYYSWEVGLIASISLPIYFVLIYGNNKRIINAQKEVMQNYALTESNYIISINGIDEVKGYNRQTPFAQLNRFIYGNLQDSVFKLGKINLFLGLWSGLNAVLIIIVILSYTSNLVLKNEMMLGELMAILGIVGSLLPSVANLALITIPINEGKVAFSRMFEFENMEKEQSGSITIKEFSSLELKDASFRFPGRKPLFTNIQINLQKNEIVALVGESGSGKSTIGQILQKAYHLEKGFVLINKNHLLDEIGYESWRNVIGIVHQEISIFQGNVLDNIVLGANEKPETIVEFCKRLGFEKYIAELPQGYATILGEEGINLSGGQKQLIALARALFHRPQLLILDEATSAMDAEMENFALGLLKSLKNEISLFFITHRLHILRNLTDKIYVLENGVISGHGNHNQLMKNENLYSRYWNNILASVNF
ncbi:MAG: peptidase domain-containing ABC transporter [Bacteroidota bacterium]